MAQRAARRRRCRSVSSRRRRRRSSCGDSAAPPPLPSPAPSQPTPPSGGTTASIQTSARTCSTQRARWRRESTSPQPTGSAIRSAPTPRSPRACAASRTPRARRRAAAPSAEPLPPRCPVSSTPSPSPDCAARWHARRCGALRPAAASAKLRSAQGAPLTTVHARGSRGGMRRGASPPLAWRCVPPQAQCRPTPRRTLSLRRRSSRCLRTTRRMAGSSPSPRPTLARSTRLSSARVPRCCRHSVPSGRRNPSRCWSPPRRYVRPRRETSQSAGRSTPAPGIAPLRTPRPRRRSRRLIFSACSSKSPPPTPRTARGSPCATRCATTFTAAGARASTLRQLTRCGEGTAATSAAPSSLARRSADVCCTPQRLPPSRRAASLCSQR
mmetsp:Transcript_8375/g.26186  ORF Transcript_8375/g.26186 Transcript_8375/m.26186 type:complete len:383 (+) Transcript_8375:300-1448(+)